MEAIVTGGAGFLLAVLWFDLMLDVQVRGQGAGPLPASVLDSIATYYRRVTTDARPMNRLVSVAMVVTLGGIVAEIAGESVDSWVGWISLPLALGPIGLAGARVVPAAVRLGRGEGSLEERSATARRIYRDHVLCFGGIAALLVVQAVSLVG